MSVLLSISVFVGILVVCGCCCIPCLRALLTILIERALGPSCEANLMPLLTVDDEEGEGHHGGGRSGGPVILDLPVWM